MILKYFFFGAVSGFFSSTPLGPINLWIADHKLSRSANAQLVVFLVAVILVDIALAGLALWGHFDFLEEAKEIKWTGIFSSAFTAILGLLLFLKARRPVPQELHLNHGSSLNSFLQGLALTGLNPAFIIFWLFVANQILANIDQNLAAIELIFFLFGVISGDIIWFGSFIWILTHLKKRTQELTLKRLRMGVGLVLLVIGLTGLGRYVYF